MRQVPQCRHLGDHWFHEDDFSINCNTGPFYTVTIFAFLAILIVPIGVPVGFLFFMRRARDIVGSVNVTLLGGAKLSSNEVDDDDDKFGFLTRDFKPQFWYYEIVVYGRKLLLSGMCIVVGRGTMAQACECDVVRHTKMQTSKSHSNVACRLCCICGGIISHASFLLDALSIDQAQHD